MTRGQKTWLLALGLAAGVSFGASAATVTTPAGMATSSDTDVDQQWFRWAESGGQTGITADYPRTDSGSALFTTPDAAGYAQWRYEARSATSFGALGKLSEFTGGSYEWYRDSTSTNSAVQAPAFGLWIDHDGSPTSTGDRTWLLYEPIYQPTHSGSPALPTDAWQHEAVTSRSIFWGNNLPAPGYCALSVFMAGGSCGGQSTINGDSVIIGVRTSVGNGWAGTFRGAADNVIFESSHAGASLSANFELPPPPPAAVPTVGEWGLAISGLLLAGLGARRLRKGRKAA
ncbi:IPTL-CTERM sorting domain-containing protein [Ottowia flava]|uniref:IPTL-CTERM sorting domain-containing protein n=1 Tax=Ottowia flava TaxID=2675430 RepID=A0ABW4KVY6_9BURK|nr:IPTL-CTERM sorting domain-containing protein [Ottowia sp. GY511]